ncbi:MAG: Tyrosine-protein kinase Wzc [Ignavibacteriae bacterium]|nr:MAG: Tyrosine-protein kinase Wzc [Ignavibacteriota bacterium]
MTNHNDTTIGQTFIEFLSIVIKYRKFLATFVIIITLITSMYAILAPKWYKATVSVFPAERADFLSTLTGISGIAKNLSAGRGLAALTGSPTELDKYIAILKSATVTDDVIEKFNLRKEYKMEDDYYEDVVKAWQKKLELNIEDEGNLTISVYSRDPQKAANIANYLVEKLNQVNTNLSVSNAKSNREFIEKRYQQNLEDIKNLENSMKDFQQKFGVIAVPEQIEATVKSMAEIYIEMYKKEVEYNVTKQNYGEEHPLTKLVKINLEELKKKINQLNTGTDLSQKDSKILIPFKQAPELANEYLKIYRNLEIQYKILEFIQPLYEQAKVEEVRNTPSVLVLDKAGPPEKKAKPRLKVYFLLGLVSSIIIGLFLVFTFEMFSKLKQNDYQKYQYLTGWIKFKKKNLN